MESFGETLQKLKEIYEQEVGGWQEKILGLTSQKNSDAQRIEELFGRNQQLREQQRALTENVKELENRLRAGLCDRCTVTQEMAKRRQQEYELSQLQSLQHISTLTNEMATLRSENKRLFGDLKSLRASLRTHNGYSAETASPEVRRSPAVVSPLPLCTNPKSTSSPAGGSIQKGEAGHGGLCITEGRYSTQTLNTLRALRWRSTAEVQTVMIENIVRRTEAPESSPLFPTSMLLLKNSTCSSSSSPTTPEKKRGSSNVHAPMPFRPRPIKSQSIPHPWHLPDNPDWVTMSVIAEGGTVIHHNPSMLLFPPMANSAPDPRQSAQERAASVQRRWPGSAPAVPKSTGSPQRGPLGQGEAVEKWEGPAPVVCEGWQGTSADSSAPSSEVAAANDAPLDLSGHVKASKGPQDPQASVRASPTDSPVSSSSSSWSSPPISSSSSVESAGSHGEQRLGEVTCQDDPEEGTQATGNSRTDKTGDPSADSETLKVPSFSISLRPVVVLENMKNNLSALNSSESWTLEGDEEEVKKEEKQDNPRKRMKLERETSSALQAPRLTERRTRMGGRPKERSLADAEQG
ncbi:hypothetical protein ACEWY4_000369 [Coilia grayii]|uniref:DNA endonuclease Ctp1 N-terminal domain-containing protein n=1 Tax=Coilia grayii TaxID=363190 RepID=A0ABD1KX03_9TELE